MNEMTGHIGSSVGGLDQLPLSQIKLDPKAQPRDHLNMDVVQAYTEDMRQGEQFPPLVVFHDGRDHWLADGFHRHYAAQGAGIEQFLCEIHQGTLDDAILFSCGANADHGYRRSNADKRRAVTRMLENEKWRGWPDREIARQCRVTHPFVMKLREELYPSSSGNDYQIDRKVTRGDSIYTMNTGGINAGRERDAGPAVVHNHRAQGTHVRAEQTTERNRCNQWGNVRGRD